jgi:uncharacterized protein YcfJ
LASVGVLALSASPGPSHARSHCEAEAQNRRVAGTVLGAVGGAIIGNQISHRGGTVVGGVVGGIAGNQLSKTHCPRGGEAREGRRVRRQGPEEAQASQGGRCAMQDQSFYDAHGELVHQQVQVCR